MKHLRQIRKGAGRSKSRCKRGCVFLENFYEKQSKDLHVFLLLLVAKVYPESLRGIKKAVTRYQARIIMDDGKV